MARTDVIVLGAGIVGHIGRVAAGEARPRGRRWSTGSGPGEQTSYGNSGVIGGSVLPAAFPRDLASVLRVGLKRATEANYHWRALPRLLPWLYAYFQASTPERLEQTARAWRPLMAGALAEHETLLAESDATRYLRKNGWLALYRSDRGFAAFAPQLALAAELGVRARAPRYGRRPGAGAEPRAGLPPGGALAGHRVSCPTRWRSRRPMRRGLPPSAAYS